MYNANAVGTHYIPKQTVAKLTMDKDIPIKDDTVAEN